MIKIVQESKLVRVCAFFARVFGGVGNLHGITFRDTIYLMNKISDYEQRVIWHEVCHTCQFATLGTVRFIYLYLRDYFRNRRDGMSKSNAYRNIGLEKEAYANETKEKVLTLYPARKVHIEAVEVYL